MFNPDFVIKYSPNDVTKAQFSHQFVKHLINNRLNNKFPVVIFIGGSSGHGKSYTALRLQEMICKNDGLNAMDYLNDINVYTPLEYPEKLNNLLHGKRLKKVRVLCVHEARVVVKAKLWYTFVNQAISDVNAMSRAIKRLCFIIISQSIKDVTVDIRDQINYYMSVYRLGYGRKKVRLKWSKLYIDDSDLSRVKLRKARLRGYVVEPSGKYRYYAPQYHIMTMPPMEMRKEFDRLDYESKAQIIKNKMTQLVKDMKREIGVGDKKINEMVKYYHDNIEALPTIGKMNHKGEFRLRPLARDMHDLTVEESRMFETLLNERLKNSPSTGEA
jgi:hypothetical protein